MTRLALLLLASCAAAQDTRPPATSVINDQHTTGGTGPVTSAQPQVDVAFDAGEEQAVYEQGIVDADQRQTERHERHAAAQLVAAEAEACRDIPPRERQHSVFAHKKAIASVEPQHDGGVRIIFKPVRGLTKTFVERDIACSRARWAVSGRDPQLAHDDPTLVDGADVHVTQQGDHIEVLVRSATPEVRQVSLP